MKNALLAIVLMTVLSLQSQEIKNRVIWYLPASNTKINGIGAGLSINSLDFEKADTVKTQVNGLAIELIGIGVLLPLTPKSPRFPIDSTRIEGELKDPILSNYPINGIAISPGGLWCEAIVNGINISGIGTVTDMVNGFTIAFFQSHQRINGLSLSLGDEAIRHYGLHVAGWSEIYLLKGVQLGLFNTSEETHGLQLGILNESKKLRGFQIGLWNVNRKRKLPLINWSFSGE